MRKWLVTILLFCTIAFAYGQEPADVTIVLNEENLIMEQPPFIENGRTLVPVRFIFEPLGLNVSWDSERQVAIGEKDGLYIEMPIGSQYVTVNGQLVVLDVPAKIYNNRTYVPLRFVSEATGALVTWESETRTVKIDSQNIVEKDIYDYLNEITLDSEDYNGPNYLNNRLLYHKVLDELLALKKTYKNQKDELNDALIQLASNRNVSLQHDNLVANMEAFHDVLLVEHEKDTEKNHTVSADGFYTLQFEGAYIYTYIRDRDYSGLRFAYNKLDNGYMLSAMPFVEDKREGIGYKLVFNLDGTLLYETYYNAENGEVISPEYIQYTAGLEVFTEESNLNSVILHMENDGLVYIPPRRDGVSQLDSFGVGYVAFPSGVEYVGYLEDWQRLGQGLYFSPEDDYTIEDNLVDLRADEIIEEIIIESMTEAEKVKAIHDYLANHILYDHTEEDDESSLIHTAYGALIQGDAVCDGYAEAFKYLLDKLEIENVLIFGEGNEEGTFIGEINHAWNLVMVDGQYKHFDVTWNDDDVNQRVRYTFYNQDNEFMDDTHQWDMEYYSKYLE